MLATSAPALRIPAAETAAVVRDADLPAILAGDGYTVSARGMTQCPFHADGAERTPSMHVWYSSERDRYVYFCHACRERGDTLAYLREKHGLSFESAIEHLRRTQQILPMAKSSVRPATPVARMSMLDQTDAIASFVEILDRVAPQARQRGADYVRGRGIDAHQLKRHPAWRLDRDDLARIGKVLAEHPEVDRMITAGVAKRDDRGTRPIWWDDVCLGVSRLRSGAPFQFWGRRLNHLAIPHLAHIKYMNQLERHGARSIPFGLDAIADARTRGVPLRVVEGQYTALGSRSLRDGQATPTMALTHRLGWSKDAGGIEADRSPLWSALLDEFRTVRAGVEICPDNDPDGMKVAEGFFLANNLVSWLRRHAVPACLRPLAQRPELDLVPAGHVGAAFGYDGFKDFCDVALSQGAASRNTPG